MLAVDRTGDKNNLQPGSMLRIRIGLYPRSKTHGRGLLRVFRAFRGYIPSAATSPAVAARMEILAGEDLRQ